MSEFKKMKVGEFLKSIEKKHNIPCHRLIDVNVVNGKKTPFGEKNDLKPHEIKNDRGRGNTFSFSIKWIPDLFMIDFDFKEDVENNDLFIYCKKVGMPYVETKKGFHFYTYIHNPNGKFCFSNQQKVYKDPNYEIDLIKINNCWETSDRIMENVRVVDRKVDIPNIHYKMLMKYLDEEKLNFCDKWKWEEGYEKPKPKPKSPPVSPTTSDDEKVEEKIEENIFDTDITELKNLVLKIKTKYGYGDWLKMAFIIIHETGGSEEGYKLFLEWSKQDEGGFESEKAVRTQWENCKRNKANGKKVTMGTLKTWYYDEYPDEKKKKSKNPYKDMYYKNCSWNDDDKCWEGKVNVEGMVELINNEFIFVKETGETIVLDGEEKSYLKKPNQLKELFSCYIFKNIKNKDMNPADIWLKHIDRRQVVKIGFDPKNIDKQGIFNIWKGLKINQSHMKDFDVNDAKPIIDHIYNIWCSQNQEYFDYVMNWFAHILQFPYKKTGVVVCLKSNKEGSGKGIIMNKLRKIIGDNHYFQCNNLDQLTGSFNGVAEGKILINLDEAVWGKDKKKEGMLKNIITEETKFVNKKNKESYIIEDYCNYIITTNNDCFAPAVEGGRRFFALNLNNKFSGVQNENKKEYFKSVNEAPSGAFAKYLFERDISTFNPREFKKTDLLQEQIQHSWCSVRKWWFNVLQEAGFKTKLDDKNGFVNLYEDARGRDNVPLQQYLIKKKYKYDSNKNKVKDDKGDYIILDQKHFYKKEFIYDVYAENCDGYKLDKTHFWITMKNHCLNGLLNADHRFKGSNQRWLEIPELETMRNKFNELQDYDYEYCEDTLGDDWE
jgi:hypothetical protein